MKTDELLILGLAGVAVFLILKSGGATAAGFTMPRFTKEVSNAAGPGQPGYGWRYFDDGTTIDPQGNYYSGGTLVWSPSW